MADDVVLLQDATWPDTTGVCCWRNDFRDAFTAAGASVGSIAVEPLAVPAPQGLPGGGRAARLPRVLRRPAGLAYRGIKRVQARAVRQPRLPSLYGPGLVVAESLAVARAALAAGVPGGRIWVLAVPPQRLNAEETSGYAAEVADLASRIHGFLTDSESSRDSLERAAAHARPVVELFPPLAGDRECPRCGIVGGPDAPAVLSGAEVVGPIALLTWNQDGTTDLDHEAEASAATAEDQVRAARRVLAAALPTRSDRAERNVLVSGFDLKFIRELSARLNNRSDLAMNLDTWPSLGHRSPQTDRLLAGADTVVAEWARPSAVWLSRNKRPGQLLIVRLHRYELDAHYPRDIDMSNVDAVVYVSPPIRRRIIDELGWPAEKLVYIPNHVDVDWLDRPKFPDARFTIGMVGIEFQNKRFDLALDILSEVRRRDPRFVLRVRTALPWSNKYAWARPTEREYVNRCLRRIEEDPQLRTAVVFDQPGRDMARWYRGVGHVLSLSDIESFHMSAAEGMASGAVPVIRPWPGANEIYGKEWIQPSVEAAADFILADADETVWCERASRAQAEIRASVDPAAAVQAWADLLHGDIAAARQRFSSFIG